MVIYSSSDLITRIAYLMSLVPRLAVKTGCTKILVETALSSLLEAAAAERIIPERNVESVADNVCLSAFIGMGYRWPITFLYLVLPALCSARPRSRSLPGLVDVVADPYHHLSRYRQPVSIQWG